MQYCGCSLEEDTCLSRASVEILGKITTKFKLVLTSKFDFIPNSAAIPGKIRGLFEDSVPKKLRIYAYYDELFEISTPSFKWTRPLR